MGKPVHDVDLSGVPRSLRQARMLARAGSACARPVAVEQELRESHRIHVKYREVRHLSGIRVSPHIYMRESELDRFVEALAEVVDKQSV